MLEIGWRSTKRAHFKKRGRFRGGHPTSRLQPTSSSLQHCIPASEHFAPHIANMEAAAIGLEAVRTAAEGGLAIAKGITMPTAPLNAYFRSLRAPPLARSSHTLSVIGHRAYIFGGEIAPRQPVDNAMHVLTLPSAELQDCDYEAVPAKPSPSSPSSDIPAARVGHAAAAINHCIYVFGGRGGPDMKALEEHGRVWCFDTTARTWTALDPANNLAESPEARSYHTAVASEHPLPPAVPNVTNVLLDEPPDAPGKNIPGPAQGMSHGTLFVHAGCLSSGERTGDLWAFDIGARSWSRFPAAPGVGRGGTSLALVGKRIYRFGGFDGERELGGAFDWLDLAIATFDDESGRGEMALTPLGKWRSDAFSVGSENSGGPPPRSVCGLVPVSTGQGRNYLLVIGGETSPSNKGHEGAGKFLDDVWTFQLKPEGMTFSAVKDATRGVLMNKDTGEAQVKEVKYYDSEGILIQESQSRPMKGRGWFASAAMGDVGGGAAVVVHGGVEEGNERLGDGWIITVE